MAKKKAAAKQALLDVPVEFGGVSIGDTTARIGVKISGERLNPMAAYDIFCGHRLDARVVLGHDDEQAGQSKLWEDVDVAVVGTCDVKGVRLTVDTISTGLTFSLPDIEVSTLAKFSKGRGRLVITGVGAIPGDEMVDTELPPAMERDDDEEDAAS